MISGSESKPADFKFQASQGAGQVKQEKQDVKQEVLLVLLLVSSPEHKVLMVTFCDWSMYGAVSAICFKGQLLHPWVNFNQTSQECCPGASPPKQLNGSAPMNKMATIAKNRNIYFEHLNRKAN